MDSIAESQSSEVVILVPEGQQGASQNLANIISREGSKNYKTNSRPAA